MSRVDELIARLCPEGVEFMEIKSFVLQPANIRWANQADAKFQYIDLTSVDRATHTITETSTITCEKAPSRAQQIVREGDVIFGTTRPMMKRYAIIPHEYDGQICSTGFCVLRPDNNIVLTSFLFHLLGTDDFYAYVEANERGASYPAIPDNVVKRFRAPVPPLEVQREIVKVLDNFTKLEMELKVALEAELEARRKQYKYYRDSLLTFCHQINPERERERERERESKECASIPERWATLGEIATVVRGASPRPIQSFLVEAENGVPWIKIGDVAAGSKYITNTANYITEVGAIKSRRVYPGDFVLSNSMSFGRPYISKIEGCIHDGWLSISNFNTAFVPDFLYHLLRSSSVQAEFARRAGAGTVQNLNADVVKSISVPVPSLKEQQRIVSILDKFDALVNDLSSGLPAEIKARRQQYEHYRDRLLTFRKAT